MSYEKPMAQYPAVHFEDHVVEYPGRFREVSNPDGTIDHEPAEGDIIQIGTPLSAHNLNTMDHGIWSLFQEMAGLKDQMLSLAVVVSTLQGSLTNGIGSNIFFTEMLDATIEVLDGWVDVPNRRVVL